jgi:hypothetical protein
LHFTSLKIVKTEKNNDCILCKSAIKETIKVYRNKLNYAISEIYPILWEIQNVKDPFSRDEILLEGVKNLINKNSNIENFYRLLHNKIITYINTIGIHTLPRHLSNWVEHTTRMINKEICKIVEYDVIFIDYNDRKDMKKYEDIKRTTAPIHFKDNIDFDIFCEIIIFLSDKTKINFYTDDKNFYNKGKKAYSLLKANLTYKDSWLKIIHVKDSI